ncbi:hypothetical protein MMC25_004189 [Agyrium rufum]|nr:hypothetical protein [Agyrium rufum]
MDHIEIRARGLCSWEDISPEVDAMMLKFIREVPDSPKNDKGEIYNSNADGEPAIVAPQVQNPDHVEDLKDMDGRPVLWGQKYFFREANEDALRLLDYEDGNKKKIIFNPKWHAGLHLKFSYAQSKNARGIAV